MAVTKRTRYEVLRRDNFACRYCRSTENPLTVDHVTPAALGGTDDPGNLVAACKDCNAGKASTSPDAATVADVSDTAIRWAQAIRAALIGRSVELMDRLELRSDFLTIWNQYHYTNGETVDLPEDWEDSLDRWSSLGVGLDLVEEACRATMTRRTVRAGQEFRYMAGIIWRTLDDVRSEVEQRMAVDD